MNNFHKGAILALNESFERVAKVAKERDAFNRQMRKNEAAYTGRWHREPDPRQAEHDAVDEQRRRAELEAQENMTDAVYVGSPLPAPPTIQGE